MKDFRDWLSAVHHSKITASEVAATLGISRATATRKLIDGLSADNVISICRSLSVNPVQALVDLGHVTESEITDFLESDGALVTTAEDGELALELARRLNPATMATEIDELAERRRNSPTAPPHVTEPDYDAILDGINAGTEPIAAQKATDPLEENYT
ncbi:hypothetical protein [Corynebacterium diphtheriae]|uniref:hypothetical protein n=1 Tax=Corynebacterium diphtheriae TaxID=1717 RepID=UPI000B4B9916|nr:hypothetical protein [Corynebacterium diphtheriae]OWM43005.1 hypothetical protein BU164_10185 [Corynebacterium diphtheriae]OWM46792.1 hypothetical protein BU163_11125 [Corynebacterium diphtheriae]